VSEPLRAAAAAVDDAAALVDAAWLRLAHAAGGGKGRVSGPALDDHQVLAYDLAHAASAVEAARVMLVYAEHGEYESRLARFFIADAVADLAAKITGREALWGVEAAELAAAQPFLEAHRSPAFIDEIADHLVRDSTGPAHLDDEFDLVRDTFHRFASDRIRPVAEHVHRANTDIPEDLISGLAELGGFGLSVPEEYGGFAVGGPHDYLGMVVATEELSWGSLGVGGSLITRPEILTRALVKGGTEEQKQRWLPRIATGELMVGVMVTEPDYGSDVASLTTSATAVDGGYRIKGVKTWATLAGRADILMLLARTDPDRASGHRGLSLFGGPTSSCCSPAPTPTAPPATGACPSSWSTRTRPPAMRSRSPSPLTRPAGAGRWKGEPSTPSGTGACTPTRWRSTTGSCPPRTSWAGPTGSGRASTFRWKGSRTGGCRPRPAPSG